MKVECTSGTGVGGDMALDLLLGEGILGRLDQPGGPELSSDRKSYCKVLKHR
jgi:hypothetical protein